VITPLLDEHEIALLLYIHTHTQREGYAPTTQDMRRALGLSQNALYRRLRALRAWGYLTNTPHATRGYRVLSLPLDAEAA
jgi:SOS-response transcriptional repressor LexA